MAADRATGAVGVPAGEGFLRPAPIVRSATRGRMEDAARSTVRRLAHTDSSPMLRISTLGRLALDDESGPVGGAGSWRPTLAALALLAAAGDQGVPRERLLAMLWPESAPEKARNSLKQLLFALRRAVPAPAVSGTAILKLDPASVTSDLWDFRGALARGDLDAAVAAYAGPFLDGFSLPGAVELERWAEGERAVLAEEFHRALSTLAERALAANDHRLAVAHLRRLAAAAPLDSDVAMRLMLALVASGNRAGALQHFEIHSALLRQELDCDPEPAVAEYAASLRELPRAVAGGSPRLVSAPAASSSAAPPAPPRPLEPRAASPLRLVVDDEIPPPVAIAEPETGAPPPVERLGSLRGRIAAGIAGLVLGALVVVVASWWRGARTSGADAPAVVAVMPFAVQASPALAYLGPGLADLLSTSLDGAGRLRSVDSRVILDAAGTDRGRAVDLRTAVSIARRLDARYYVLGGVVEAGGRLRISAYLYDRSAGESPLAQESVESTPDSVFAAVDALAAKLLVERFRTPGERLSRAAAMSTTSLPALKAYLDGESAFRDGDYARASEAYARAVAADSTFALAHYRLSQAADWAGSDDAVLPSAERAVRFANHLSAQDNLLVRAFVQWRTGRLDDAERLYRTELADHPDDVEGWYQLGTLLFQGNPLRGRDATEARPAFERVLALDPDNADALVHLARIASLEERPAQVDSIVRRVLALGPARDVLELRAFRAFALGDRQGQKRVTTELVASAASVPAVTALEVATYADDLEGTERFGRALAEPRRPREVQGYGHRLLAQTAAARGQWRTAERELAAAAPFDSVAALELRSLLVVLPFLPVQRAELEDVRAALARWQPVENESADDIHWKAHLGLHPALRLYELGLVSARLGDTAAVMDYVRRLESATSDSVAAGVRRVARETFAHSLRARLADARGRPEDALAELERADWPRIASSFTSEALDRYYRADLLQRLGRSEEARDWYRSIAQRATYELPFLAPARAALARLGR
jgi:DNA-binding SARP family transcriptional activator/TolB-like protein